jgi:ABC-type Na+ efflux pump permease subunit
MYRTYVIARHTFHEAILQPIYSLLIAIGVIILTIFGVLPFFTFGEDTTMFKTVALDVVLILVLITTLFATSRSIFEEIEDRTMLTLMSKPVRRWEVMVGKYLGIILSSLLAVAILGLVMCLCTAWRIPTDYQLRVNTLNDVELKQISDLRTMHIMGLIPSLFLTWVQIAVLAAIGVALSTRFSLVVNLPLVILLYVAGNLTRFLLPMNSPGHSIILRAFAYIVSLVLPYLENFDLKPLAVLRPIAVPGTSYENATNMITLGNIWSYVGISTLYAFFYATFALAFGMYLFRTRELGGAEG